MEGTRSPAPLQLDVISESWSLKQPFTISRGTTTSTDVVVVTLGDGAHRGRGECCPARRYGQTIQSVIDDIESVRKAIESGISRADAQALLPRGAARNALDCALWDLEAKRSGRSAWGLAGIQPLASLTTAVTITLNTPERMAGQAALVRDCPVLKIKLGAPGDLERVQAVREAAPNARLSVDVNEGWNADQLAQFVVPLAKLGVELLEQPLPASQDEALRGFASPIPLAADESCSDVQSLERVIGKYQVINIKLDKSGGLTEALKLVEAARQHRLGIMIGCMMGTSLAMAPGFIIASQCQFVDLDAPLNNVNDREHAMRYDHGRLEVFEPALWG